MLFRNDCTAESGHQPYCLRVLASSHRMVFHYCMRIVAVVALVLGPILAASPETIAAQASCEEESGFFASISDALSLGRNTVVCAKSAIRDADKLLRTVDDVTKKRLIELKTILSGFVSDLETLLDEISKTYQDNLNITINSLESAMRRQFILLRAEMVRVNELLKEDIRLIGDEARATINSAAERVRQASIEMEGHLENIIVLGTTNVVYILDRATDYALMVLSFIMLGATLLSVIWLTYRQRFPSDQPRRAVALGTMATAVALFLVLTFSGPTRAYAMAYSGIGLKQRIETIPPTRPRIAAIMPDRLVFGETRFLNVEGVSLTPGGESPEVSIAGISLESHASDGKVVITVGDFQIEGNDEEEAADIVLNYARLDGQVSHPVILVRPTPVQADPDLAITAFSVTPLDLVKGSIVRATIEVVNQGGKASGPFSVKWIPRPNADRFEEISNLEPLQSTFVQLEFYSDMAGSFDSVAEIDIADTVSESNEINNTMIRQIVVREVPAPQQDPPQQDPPQQDPPQQDPPERPNCSPGQDFLRCGQCWPRHNPCP